MKRLKITPLQLIVHLLALTPLMLLFWDALQNNLSAEPIREATLRTGKSALVMLMASLACSPINTIFKFKPVLRMRRPLGLYAFLYASIHFVIFIAVDYAFDLQLIKGALLEKKYALAGLATGFILLLLAITSTNGWKRRLRKKWKPLHRFVYLAGSLAIVHYIWLVKQGVFEPWIYAGVIIILLVLRLTTIKKWLANKKFRKMRMALPFFVKVI